MVTAEEFVYPGELDLAGLQADYGGLLIDGEFVAIGFNAGDHYEVDSDPLYNLVALGISGPNILIWADRWVFTNKRLLVIEGIPITPSVLDEYPGVMDYPFNWDPLVRGRDWLSIPYRSILTYRFRTGGIRRDGSSCVGLTLRVQSAREELTAEIQGVDIYKLQNFLDRNLLEK